MRERTEGRVAPARASLAAESEHILEVEPRRAGWGERPGEGRARGTREYAGAEPRVQLGALSWDGSRGCRSDGPVLFHRQPSSAPGAGEAEGQSLVSLNPHPLNSLGRGQA